MMKIKTIKITWLCIIAALLVPTLSQAESTGTGSIAATQAAEQREALAKKAAERQAKKAAAGQLKAIPEQPASAPATPAAEPKKDEAPAQ